MKFVSCHTQGLTISPLGRFGVLASLMVLGLLLRLNRVDEEVLTNDEAFSWRVSSRPLEVMSRQVALDTHPLLHFFLIKQMQVFFGSSALSLRALSIVAGVGTIGLVYILSIQAIKYTQGMNFSITFKCYISSLLASMYIAVHPLHYEFSRTGRMYSLGTFLAALSSILFFMMIRFRFESKYLNYLYAIVIALLLHTHNFGFFIMIPQFLFSLWVILSLSDRTSVLRNTCGPAIVVFLLYLPWVKSFLLQAKRVQDGFWILPITLRSFVESLFSFVFGVQDKQSFDFTPSFVVVLLLLFAVIIRESDRRIWCLPIQAAFPWIITILVFNFSGRSILQDRYLLLASPVFVSWAALVMMKCRRGSYFLLAFNLLVPTCFALLSTIHNSSFTPAPILQAIMFLRVNSRPGDLVLVGDPAIVNLLRYYESRVPGPRLDIRYVMDTFESTLPGQVNHLSSLDANEVFFDSRLEEINCERVWVLNRACELTIFGWKRSQDVLFGPTRGIFSEGIHISRYLK